MEAAFEWVLVSSPLLVILALIQRKLSRPLALFGLAILFGGLTAITGSLPLSGPDAAMDRGWLVIYGATATVIMMLLAAWTFMSSGPRPEAAAVDEAGTESDSVNMFNRTRRGDETDR